MLLCYFTLLLSTTVTVEMLYCLVNVADAVAEVVAAVYIVVCMHQGQRPLSPTSGHTVHLAMRVKGFSFAAALRIKSPVPNPL